jgi:CDP-paratose 2-epimerase
MGGGPENTLSLLELLALLEARTGAPIPVTFADWRPSDQKVYISDIRHATAELGWSPSVAPREGVARLADWVEANRSRFTP